MYHRVNTFKGSGEADAIEKGDTWMKKEKEAPLARAEIRAGQRGLARERDPNGKSGINC